MVKIPPRDRVDSSDRSPLSGKKSYQKSHRIRWAFPLLILLAFAIGAWAAVPVFFPSNNPGHDNPYALGTLGGALEFYRDGSAPNAEMLAGTSADEYLKTGVCPGSQVYKGIDSSGRPICGDRSSQLAMKMNLTDGSLQINGQTHDAPYSWTALGNDQIETDANQSATLQFDADKSIIRMDRNTRISLVAGSNESGHTIAQAVLDHGVLWGRILTSDGVNFSHGGIVAGVRGTALKFATDAKKPDKLQIALVQSTNEGTTKVFNTDSSEAIHIICGEDEQKALRLGTEKEFNVRDCSASDTTLYSSIDQIYRDDRFVANNVIEDIMYLNSLPTSRAPDSPVAREKSITIPTGADPMMVKDVRDALCGEGETYWTIFEGSADKSVCNNMLAYIDFTSAGGANRGKWIDKNGSNLDMGPEGMNGKIFGYSGSNNSCITMFSSDKFLVPGPKSFNRECIPNYDPISFTWNLDDTTGIFIGTGKIISIPLSAFNIIGGLAGKTIEIEYNSLPAAENGGMGKSIIALGGSNYLMRTYEGFICKISDNTPKACTKISTDIFHNPHSDNNRIIFTIGSNIDNSGSDQIIYIGNYFTGSLQFPINTSIKSISISN